MKVFIRTFGCSANQNDSEMIAAVLEKKGFKVVDSVDKADFVVINSCVVKGPTENKVVKEIKSVLRKKKILVIAGCMPEAEYDLIKEIAPKASLVGPGHIEQIAEAVSARKEFIGKKKSVKIGSKKRKNPVINITQLSTGCTGECIYCIVKLAKGSLFSFPEQAIINDVECAVKDGCKEIWLTSQDNAAYGIDRDTNLAELLKKITALKGYFKIRIGMMDPNNVLPILKELVNAYKDEKIFKFIHIPVQSGSDEILRKMNRHYSVGDFKKVIKDFRKQIPKLSVSTDIIVGFPGETEKQFEESVKLVKEIKPDVLNISRFWPRPGTKAAKMIPQIQGKVTKVRSQKLTSEFNKVAFTKNKKWVGWKGKALVDEKGSNDSWIARNFAYKPVIVFSEKNLMGKEVVGRVSSATNRTLLIRNRS